MGSPVTFWESYFLGWIVFYLNRRALVLTDRRILLIQIDSKGRPKQLLSQIRYGAMKEVKKSFLHGTVVRLRNGKSRSFAGVPRADRRFLTELVSRVQAIRSGDQETQSIEELCPHCHEVAQIGSPGCSNCGGAFKVPKRAGMLSLLFPGFGDIYLGHRTLAAFEILVVAVIWMGALLPDPEYPLTGLGFVILAAFLVIFIHVPDAVGTWYIARMGLYPHARS
jgi:hypothetical protein